jgi:GNAT superfamily N-acetyltransferase
MTVVHCTRDKTRIQAFLQRDPVWGAYALGDLEAAHFRLCNWYLAGSSPQDSDGLALFYQGLDPPVVLTVGSDTAIAAIFQVAELPERAYMSAQEHHLPTFQAWYDFSADQVRPMVRMAVSAQQFRPHGAALSNLLRLCRLDSGDALAIERLVAGGGPYAPDAFRPSQVDQGVFFGLWQEEELVAVAGTHLVAPNWGVSAVGNVYTHPRWRGRGFGSAVTSAVTAALVGQGLRVVLNVGRDNQVARSLYGKLGYQVYCSFLEGVGRKRPLAVSDQIRRNSLSAFKRGEM